MLFVDLVGYTALSETRDAEDVRELLGRYFDEAKTIVGRYGGTIEKFIGDAVMAVWGTPIAREDDAERAVRAGLELVDAVVAFGGEIGAPELRARAGIVTGRVASSANPDEALVVGDRVNTASRVQAAADPGTVFVDEVTRQVTLASIAYADAGERTVKGKVEPLRLYRALRAVAGVAGNQRAAALEAPFVGRDAELRLVKDLYHAAVDLGVARLVGVTGAAGVGKSRLGWEFSKYSDGIADTVLWHSGRSLSYGEGVAYWALAEIVRQRLGIAEDASEAEAATKLAAGVERWILDEGERRRVATALGALIGTADPGLAREELFSGWRLFFERLSDVNPVVLLFEDMQWADDGLLDFIEQLLEWSADRPIFVIAFARSELAERRPGWPAEVRGATTIRLAPLGDDSVSALLEGLVTDLPAEAAGSIVAQAEGIPLYAVETVRTLADRGVLTQVDDRLEPAGEIGELDVPASLSSLLAARLDALGADERDLIKAMAVFGSSFPRATVAALTELPAERVDEVLAGLVRRDILAIDSNPLSPESRSVPVRAGAVADGGLRDDPAARTPPASPRRRRAPARRVPERGRGRRRGDRGPPARRLPRRWRHPRRRAAGADGGSAAPGRRAQRIGGGAGHGAAHAENRGRARSRRGRAAGAARGRGADGAPGRGLSGVAGPVRGGARGARGGRTVAGRRPAGG